MIRRSVGGGGDTLGHLGLLAAVLVALIGALVVFAVTGLDVGVLAVGADLGDS